MLIVIYGCQDVNKMQVLHAVLWYVQVLQLQLQQMQLVVHLEKDA